MSKHRFLYQLAVERCQHNLAQLCAVAYVDQEHSNDEGCGCGCHQNNEMARLLIESLERDLSFMNTLSGFIDPRGQGIQDPSIEKISE